ncbi:MAG TPA: DNA-binding protein [Candidatus Obscuribacterales bacterium]
MPRRAVIDREELFKTANALATEGKDVTALALLNALGGGRLTTIYKYLAEWEASQPKTTQAAGSAEIPEPVQAAFASAWRAAATEAAKETTAVKEKAAEEVNAAQKKFEEALEGIQKLEVQSEQDSAQIEALKAAVSELEEQLSQARREAAGLRAAANELRNQVQSQQAELERLHKTIEEERKKYKKRRVCRTRWADGKKYKKRCVSRTRWADRLREAQVPPLFLKRESPFVILACGLIEHPTPEGRSNRARSGRLRYATRLSRSGNRSGARLTEPASLPSGTAKVAARARGQLASRPYHTLDLYRLWYGCMEMRPSLRLSNKPAGTAGNSYIRANRRRDALSRRASSGNG